MKKPETGDTATMAELTLRLDALEDMAKAVARAGPVRNMTMTQFAILAHIRKDDPVPLRDVADALKVKKPLVSRAMDRFEEQGLAKRHPDPHDRRSVHLGLTYKGRMFLQRIAKNMQQSIADATPEDPA